MFAKNTDDKIPAQFLENICHIYKILQNIFILRIVQLNRVQPVAILDYGFNLCLILKIDG